MLGDGDQTRWLVKPDNGKETSLSLCLAALILAALAGIMALAYWCS